MDEPNKTPESPTRWLLIGGAIVLGLCCLLGIAGLVLVEVGPAAGAVFSRIQSSLSEVTPATGSDAPRPGSDVASQANTRGDPGAPVTIVEYADFQCPFCERFWTETEGQIVDDYVATGQVYLEFRSMGDFIGPESARAAEAAYCAGDQDRFWEYHDLLFANQGAENSGAFADERLTGFAAQAGLDPGDFRDCFTGGKYTEAVRRDQSDGLAAGVQGTPSFLINGTLLEGAQPYEDMAAAIEQALAGK